MGPDLIGSLLQTALLCAREGLTHQVTRMLVAPGAEVAWDECCDGMLWTRLLQVVPAQLMQQGQGPFGMTRVGPCGVLMWEATIGVGVLRCASMVDDAGQAPAPATLTAEALQVVQDMADVAAALQCCVAPQAEKLTMGMWTPLGPEGGCVGGEWTAAVLVSNCPCPG